MLHLAGGSDIKIMELAKQEIDIMIQNGIDAVMVENYFGPVRSVLGVLSYLSKNLANITYGVNILGLENNNLSFLYGEAYGAKFIQIDSVVGHLYQSDETKYFEELNELRAKYSNDIFLLGGVRFKYQPVYSNRSEQEDLNIGMTLCDGIVVTGSGTGIETNLDKIKSFRRAINDFPLFVGAGLTVENCYEQLSIADGCIVGSYLKDNYKDFGNVSKDHILTFMNEVKRLR